MNRTIKIILAIIFFSLISISIVTASNTSAEIVVDKTTLKPGDTFTITLKANCSGGLSFISTKLNYDTNKLTLKSKNIANDWVDYGTDKIELFSNSSNKFTNLDACTWTFEVNKNVENGTIVIGTTDIEITDINNVEYKLVKSEKTLNIKVEENIQDENKDNNSDEEQKEDKVQDTGKETEKKEENKKDTSVSNKIIPKAGKTSIILLAIIVLVVICIVLGIKNKKYKI